MRFPLIVLVLVMVLGQAAMGKAEVKLSPSEKVGAQTVQIAYVETDLEWLIEQRYFLVDGKKYKLPPASLYDPVFSAPRWVSEKKKITGLKFWQFDKKAGRRRAIHASFPSYKVISRGKWERHMGGDTVPDPPK